MIQKLPETELKAGADVMEWVPYPPAKITANDIINACMLFDRDKNLFQSYLLDISIARQLNETGKWELEQYWLNLMASKVDEVRLKKAITESARKGHLAGWMFAVLYIMWRENIDEPSKGKASHVVSEFAKGKVWRNSDKGIAATPKYISRVFSDKKAVLHYWAAMVLNHQDSYQYTSQLNIPAMGADFELFIRAAKDLQNFGLTHISTRNKRDCPPISADSLWLIDDSVVPYSIPLVGSPDSVYESVYSYKADFLKIKPL